MITWPYRLRKGHSDDPAEGACAMDAVNWLVHGRHGDQPECACPVIGAFVIGGNDAMDGTTRQRLLAYLPRIAGSRSEEHETARTRILVLAATRVFAPRALDAAGLHEFSGVLRSLPDDVSFLDVLELTVEIARVAHNAKPTWTAQVVNAAAAAATGAAETIWATRTEALTAAAGHAAKAAKFAAFGAAYMAQKEHMVARATAAQAHWAATDAAATVWWGDYFPVLDAALSAGPQGEPWSADVIERGAQEYASHGGLLVTAQGKD